MSTHYRQQFNFTFEGLESQKLRWSGCVTLCGDCMKWRAQRALVKVKVLTDKLEACFGGSMDDDLNVAVALASLFDFVREMNALLDANLVSKEEAADEVGGLMMRLDLKFWV
jgi:cysteinyl-tRNA synthetase